MHLVSKFVTLSKAEEKIQMPEEEDMVFQCSRRKEYISLSVS